MKKRFTLCAATTLLCAVGCGGDEYDDSALRKDLTDLANRVAKLEQLCQQMNTNISSLQTIVNALQQNDYITSVAPVTQDGKVIGYTITFARSGTITIYHGEDGKDGNTPQVGVKKDTDGFYYWTIDGEWLLDVNGSKIQANGEHGTNGIDGITPRLKIENDYWYISYDNGATWTQLGKATGNNGINGDNFFTSITQDEESVYFNLADGTMITLPKHDKENIQFEDVRVKAICCKKWDTNKDGELSYKEAAAVISIGYVFEDNEDIISFPEFKYFTGLDMQYSNSFYGCKNLWKIELPENLTTIGDAMFMDCSNLSNLVLPDNVSIIDRKAFYNTDLKSIVLPKSIASIGEQAFYTQGDLDIYCKAETPPAVYYYTYTSGGSYTTTTKVGFIKFNSMYYETTIYVPAEFYDAYIENRGGANGEIHIGNWYQYRDYVKPYNFE